MTPQALTLVCKRIAMFFGAFCFIIVPSFSSSQEVEKPSMQDISPYLMLFDPEANGVVLDRQRIDYNLTKGSQLRIGPHYLKASDIEMKMSREVGEYVKLNFGFEESLEYGPVYVLSFTWPQEYLKTGLMEIINDKSESLWKRSIDNVDLRYWKGITAQLSDLTDEDVKELKRREGIDDKDKVKIIARPQKLSDIHLESSFGFANRGIAEFPMTEVKGPIRFCLSKEKGIGRLAFCSRRYQFVRRYGQIKLVPVSKQVRPRVMVNEKPVKLNGTAVFLDYETPIKLSAMMNNGTYYEFVAQPRDIHVVDIVEDRKAKRVEIIGYGDQPTGDVVEDTFYIDTVAEGILNFLPTIGDVRTYWRARIPREGAHVYLKGDGGIPFRQNFNFDDLPSKKARAIVAKDTQRVTYRRTFPLVGALDPSITIKNELEVAQRINKNEFEWNFNAPEKGKFNTGTLLFEEDGKEWKSSYKIYRGYSGELSARLTGILSDDLDIVFLGEVAAQYWFERFLGSRDYKASLMRWGVSAKYFQDVWIATEDPENQSIVGLKVANVDIKYRFTPGVWQRDPTVGALISAQQVEYSFRSNSEDFDTDNTMFGGGVFWARSMPKVFDDWLNFIPLLRYPKWVDFEFIVYPFPFEPKKSLILNTALNFHGKIQWTDQFFGEAGFGLKAISYKDRTLGANGKRVGLGLGYGTLGLGFNF